MSNFERVGPRHPEACQGNTGNGRCNFRAVAGSQFCPIHGGGIARAANQRQELRNYTLSTIFGKRAAELASSTHLKDLTDEIALMRLSLESVLKLCKSDTDFLLYNDKIATSLKTVQSLIESMQKLQEKNKELVDRQTLMAVADDILSIILNYVGDPDRQKECGEAIYGCIINRLGE